MPSIIRKIVFRGHGHCIAFPEKLLKFAGLELGGVCALEPLGDGTIRIRRVTPDDFVGEVNISTQLLEAERHGSR
jgi:hypothetical protein